MFIVFREKKELKNQKIKLTKQEINHIKALRLKNGNSILVCDGSGKAYKGVISDEFVFFSFDESLENNFENIAIFSALPSGNRLDKMIESSTALGMSRFIPLIFEHSERKEYNIDRMDRIARQSCYQSKRFTIPKFDEPIHFIQLFQKEFIKDYFIFFLDPYEDSMTVKEFMEILSRKELKNIGVIIGPEGGFSYKEKQILNQSLKCLKISPYILRIEVAVISILSICSFLKKR